MNVIISQLMSRKLELYQILILMTSKKTLLILRHAVFANRITMNWKLLNRCIVHKFSHKYI